MKTKMRIVLMLAVLGTIGVFTAEAQRGRGAGWERGPGYGRGYGAGFGPDSCHMQLMVNDLARDLSLSSEEEEKILQLHYQHMEEVKSFRDEYRNDCVGAREARIASREKLDKAIADLLTDEQYEKYEAFMQERRGPHGRGYRRGQ